MIFQNSDSTGVVASSGTGSTSVARIATTAHMFSILSSRLYSDKVAAVLREIGCNAHDAHVAAAKPAVPFEVKLPNQVDPSFYIKDWGPGLDEDGVRTLYMTYGESTKQNSNQFVGAMGLGSKSPFAYAHTFTIVAAKNGVKRYFTAYLNEDRVPVVTKTLEVEAEANWQNGLMVTFPVESRDICEFHEKSRIVYSWFTVAPTVLGLPNEEKPSFPEFALYKPGRYGFRPKNPAYARGPAVVMGNIRYPLEMDKVYARFPELREAFQTIADGAVHLFVEIGEVLFTPNREALEYEKGTLETLRSRFVEVIKDIGSTLAARLAEKEDTKVAYLRKLEALRSEYAPTGLLACKDLPQLLAVLGMDPDEIAKLPSLKKELCIVANDKVGSKFLHDDQRSDGAPYLRLMLVRKGLEGRRGGRSLRTVEVVRGRYYLSRAAGATASSLTFSARAKVAVFYLEGKKDGKAKVQALVASDELDYALLVLPEGGATAEDAANFAEFLAGPDALDGYPVLSTMTLDVPKERVRQLLNRRTTRLSQAERMQRISVLVQETLRTAHKSDLYTEVQSGATYYAVVDEINGTRSYSRGLKGDNGDMASLSQERLCDLLRSGELSAMNKALGGTESITSVLLLTPSSMKRFDPKTVGMVNIVDVLSSWLENEESLSTLASFVDDWEAVDVVYLGVCMHRDPLPRLAALRGEGSAFWRAIETRYAGTETLKALDVYVKHLRERETAKAANPVCSGLRALRRSGLAHKVNALLNGKPSPRAEFLRNVHERLSPALALLNWEGLCTRAAGGDVSGAMAFFDFAMMHFGDMPVRIRQESTV